MILAAVSRYPEIAIFALAALVRVGAVLVWGPASGGDTVQYREAAEALRRDPFDPVAFPGLPPLFPVLMALVPGDRPVALAQALIGALVGPLAYRTVRPHFGENAGWLAGLLAALQPTFIFWSRYLLTDTLGLVCFAFAVERASALLGNGRRGVLGAGAAGALAFLARAAYAFPVLAMGVVVVAFGKARDRRMALLLLGAGIVLAVPLARNVVALGDPVVYRDQGMLLVWMGTRWTIEGRGSQGIDLIYPAGYESWSRSERRRYHRDDAIAAITAQPGEYAARTAGKVLWFWSPLFPEWSITHKLFTGTYITALYLLAAIGLARRWKTHLGVLLLVAAFAIQLTVAATIVDYDNRYRIPLEYCLVPFAAAGLSSALVRVRPKLVSAVAGRADPGTPSRGPRRRPR